MTYLCIIRDVYRKELDRVSLEGTPEQCAIWALNHMQQISGLVICTAELYDPRFASFIYRISTWQQHPAIQCPRKPSMAAGRKITLNPQLTLAL
jgi:hypothetical protein